MNFVHCKTTHVVPPHVSMSDIKREIKKGKSVRRRPRTTSLSHMANQRKAVKEVYLGVLGYDIATYTKLSGRPAQEEYPPSEKPWMKGG